MATHATKDESTYVCVATNAKKAQSVVVALTTAQTRGPSRPWCGGAATSTRVRARRGWVVIDEEKEDVISLCGGMGCVRQRKMACSLQSQGLTSTNEPPPPLAG